MQENIIQSGEQLWEQTHTNEQYQTLTSQERTELIEHFCCRLDTIYNSKDKSEAELIMSKAKKVFNEEKYDHFKNQTWGYNHHLIRTAITRYVTDYGRMPSSAELRVESGLSRYTVSKHLKEFIEHPQQIEEMELFKFMSTKLLSSVLRLALKGDMRAAKIYLDNIMPKNTGTNFVKNQQNNFININGVELNEKTLAALPKESLEQICQIIRKAQQPLPMQQAEVVG